MPQSAPTTVTRCSVPLRILATATFLFALSGCVDLDDAAGLSKLSEQAKVALRKVSNDVAATCERQNVLFEDTPAAERARTEQPLDCVPYQDVSTELAKDQNVLTAYFDALGKLASNKPMSYDTAIDANNKTIAANTALATDTAKAGTAADSIMKALADAATRGYREKQLGSLIKANDPAVQSLTEALKKVIAVDYVQILSNEKIRLDMFYTGPIAAAQPSERLSLILVQRQYAGDTSALQSRIAAAADYGKIMGDLAALHSKLKEEANSKADIKQVSKELGPLVSALAKSISDLESRSK